MRKHPPPVQIEEAVPPTEDTPLDTRAPLLTRLGVTLVMAIADLDVSQPAVLVGDNVIITGKKHKMQILQEYEDEFGANHPKPIITQKKGKHSLKPDTVRPTRMSPTIKKFYRVQELTIYNVITMVIREYRSSFKYADLHNLAIINKDFLRMIPKTIRWLKLDFSPLCEPRYDYESQTTISSSRVEMA